MEIDEKIALIGEKYTFAGVLYQYFEEIAARWNDNTRKAYLGQYQGQILPRLADRPLEEYTREDFDQVIHDIDMQYAQRNSGQRYAANTLQHYRYLIRVVLKAAAAHDVCPDILWGTLFSIVSEEKAEATKIKEFVRLRKSLTVQEERRIVEKLFTDPMQSGQNMGLALMFALGLRNGEACGVNFGAIREMESHPDHHCLWIYQSTGYSSNELHAGGKTANTPRILPIPQKLYSLLEKRRQFLETSLFDSGMYLDDIWGPQSVDDLPVACVDNSFTLRCQSSHLTKAGQVLLKEIQVSEDELAYVDRDLQNPGLAQEMGVVEKDPTVYLFRRNLGTHLYLLGLSESEIQYVMGHDIEDPYLSRNDFTNEELLYNIKVKMENRPLVNDSFPYLEPEQLQGRAGRISFADVPRKSVVLHKGARIHAMIQSMEPGSPVHINSEQPMVGAVSVFNGTESTERTTNITSQYQRIYNKKRK